jgi:hypothetical protein
MKPLITENRDGATLQNLGRASLQIIHDIKNQLNGLKLYATYLRKRLDKSEQPTELQETVAKLVAGLDRAANDLNVLTQYGRPLALNKQPGIDIQKLMRGVSENLPETAGCSSTGPLIIEAGAAPLIGEFDASALSDAFRAICCSALKTQSRNPSGTLKVRLRLENGESEPAALIEWEPVRFENGDPFNSFNGSEAIRMSLAAKIVEAHGGSAQHQEHVIRVWLPLT